MLYAPSTLPMRLPPLPPPAALNMIYETNVASRLTRGTFSQAGTSVHQQSGTQINIPDSQVSNPAISRAGGSWYGPTSSVSGVNNR